MNTKVPSIGHPSTAYVVPTPWLAELLEPEIRRLDRIADAPSNGQNGNPCSGGIALLAERAALHHDSGQAAITRRIWGILNGESRATNAELADALLLACGIFISQTNLPCLPAGKKAAVEMLTIYAELNGEEWDELLIQRLAAKLLHFANGFIAAPTVTALADAPVLVTSAV